uniref:Uncharacterized protein n=1 Tax=Knipowitschia caucasica TaxID=637954 RepID=A0AAV2KQY1_KNICA
MSERRSLLRAAVNERLAAAAEEIFVLLERTIAEYEEEVCRSKEQNQRNQQLLEALLTRGSDSFCPDPSLKQETPQTIEEPSEQEEEEAEERLKQEEEEAEERLKQEEEKLPDFTAVCVKSEEQSSLIEEDREEAQGQLCGGADISSQTHLHSETEEQRHHSYTDHDEDPDEDHDEDYDEDHDEDWVHPGSSSTAQMQTEAEGDLYNQVHTQGLSGTGPRDLLSGTGPRDLLSGTGPRDLLSGTGPRDLLQRSPLPLTHTWRTALHTPG